MAFVHALHINAEPCAIEEETLRAIASLVDEEKQVASKHVLFHLFGSNGKEAIVRATQVGSFRIGEHANTARASDQLSARKICAASARSKPVSS